MTMGSPILATQLPTLPPLVTEEMSTPAPDVDPMEPTEKTPDTTSSVFQKTIESETTTFTAPVTTSAYKEIKLEDIEGLNSGSYTTEGLKNRFFSISLIGVFVHHLKSLSRFAFLLDFY